MIVGGAEGLQIIKTIVIQGKVCREVVKPYKVIEVKLLCKYFLVEKLSRPLYLYTYVCARVRVYIPLVVLVARLIVNVYQPGMLDIVISRLYE